MEGSYCCGGKEFVVDGGFTLCSSNPGGLFVSLWHKYGMLIVMAQTVPGLSATVKHGSTNSLMLRVLFLGAACPKIHVHP